MSNSNKTALPTLRRALRQVRAEMAGESYLSGPREYACDRGTLLVRNRRSGPGGDRLLGLFEAELVDEQSRRIAVYEV